MPRINLARSSPRLRGVYLRWPAHLDGAAILAPRVQLLRPFPRPRTPVWAKLHLPGYRATPERVAPLCSTGSGPYGRVVWVRTDRPELCPLCPECAARRGMPDELAQKQPSNCSNGAAARAETL